MNHTTESTLIFANALILDSLALSEQRTRDRLAELVGDLSLEADAAFDRATLALFRLVSVRKTLIQALHFKVNYEALRPEDLHPDNDPDPEPNDGLTPEQRHYCAILSAQIRQHRASEAKRLAELKEKEAAEHLAAANALLNEDATDSPESGKPTPSGDAFDSVRSSDFSLNIDDASGEAPLAPAADSSSSFDSAFHTPHSAFPPMPPISPILSMGPIRPISPIPHLHHPALSSAPSANSAVKNSSASLAPLSAIRTAQSIRSVPTCPSLKNRNLHEHINQTNQLLDIDDPITDPTPSTPTPTPPSTSNCPDSHNSHASHNSHSTQSIHSPATQASDTINPPPPDPPPRFDGS